MVCLTMPPLTDHMGPLDSCEDGADPPSPDVEEMLSKLPGSNTTRLC